MHVSITSALQPRASTKAAAATARAVERNGIEAVGVGLRKVDEPASMGWRGGSRGRQWRSGGGEDAGWRVERASVPRVVGCLASTVLPVGLGRAVKKWPPEAFQSRKGPAIAQKLRRNPNKPLLVQIVRLGEGVPERLGDEAPGEVLGAARGRRRGAGSGGRADDSRSCHPDAEPLRSQNSRKPEGEAGPVPSRHPTSTHPAARRARCSGAGFSHDVDRRGPLEANLTAAARHR